MTALSGAFHNLHTPVAPIALLDAGDAPARQGEWTRVFGAETSRRRVARRRPPPCGERDHSADPTPRCSR